jgi:hypothetical protein
VRQESKYKCETLHDHECHSRCHLLLLDGGRIDRQHGHYFVRKAMKAGKDVSHFTLIIDQSSLPRTLPLLIFALCLNGVGIGGEQVAGVVDALHEAV